MIKQEIIQRNPLLNLGFENDYILKSGDFGAVLAYAGVGKTALLVQMALHAMMHEQPVFRCLVSRIIQRYGIQI